MYKSPAGGLVYSPTDLVRFLESPFASWMDRHHLENPGQFTPDADSKSDTLIAEAGNVFEQAVLTEYLGTGADVAQVDRKQASAPLVTREALAARRPIIYQARLDAAPFAGYADFLILGAHGRYEVWDTKLARSPKTKYPIQLCAYAEMLAAMTGEPLAEHFGIVLGTRQRVTFRTEDFIHFYRAVKARFLALQDRYTGNLDDRPDPAPRAQNGRWESVALDWLVERDHLIQVAGISTGQIKKLHAAGVETVAALALAGDVVVRKLAVESQARLVAQARLQVATRNARKTDPECRPVYELLPGAGPNGEPVGLAALPPEHAADVFFDMEGYPLAEGGLEYLFGACVHDGKGAFAFHDWWAHDRAQERTAFEGFIDWAYARWKAHPGMHIYHYAAYERSAVQRLSTQHNTRQDEVDELLRGEVFVDLYQTVRHGIRVGEESYSLKVIERLYRPKRDTDVATAADSIVQYNHWMTSGEPGRWEKSPILRGIRDYNADDCRSTGELAAWLRKAAADGDFPPGPAQPVNLETEPDENAEERQRCIAERKQLVDALRAKGDPTSVLLSDLVDFHRRESKPMWWRLFNRRTATRDELRDDGDCIADVSAAGRPWVDKKSAVQAYEFDPDQDCRLTAGARSRVMFTHNLAAKFTLTELDTDAGTITLKIGQPALARQFSDAFPPVGSLIPDEFVDPKPIPNGLRAIAEAGLRGALPSSSATLLARTPVSAPMDTRESAVDAAVRIAKNLNGGWFAVQGPPGTGKTYTAAHVIAALLDAGKTVGISSNSHKAVLNLFRECGKVMESLTGLKVGGERDEQFHEAFPGVRHETSAKAARAAYQGGVVGGTAWLFSREDWVGALDYLIIDEAGQVSLANAIAMSGCATNLILLGDQMQLEQPIQGAHPGDSGLSALQFALKDLEASRESAPEFHAVVPASLGIFLGESRRMHPDVCRFISESIYEGRLQSHPDCARQAVGVPAAAGQLVSRSSGIVFSPVEHDGNTQVSSEEVERVVAIYKELVGRPFTDATGTPHPLTLQDFLFIAPYNAQVRALKAALPQGARVGSVDRFQGQEAPVCITSLCSSYGEYGGRGLSFILDRNRLNVAISRAKCLAVVVGDPRLEMAMPSSVDEMRLVNLFAKIVAVG